MPKLVDAALDVAADEYCIHGMVDFCRQFLRLADKLEGDGMDCAFLMLDVDGDAVPLALVDRGLHLVLDELHDARRAFLHAQLTELAGRVDLKLAVLVFKRVERADGDDLFHDLLAGDFVLMDNEFPHVHFLQFLFDSRTAKLAAPLGQFPAFSGIKR